MRCAVAMVALAAAAAGRHGQWSCGRASARARQERNSRLPCENLTRRAHWGSQSVWIRVSAVFRVRINTDPSDIRADLCSVSRAKEPWAEPSQPQPLPTPGDREGACAHVWRSSLGTREAVL